MPVEKPQRDDLVTRTDCWGHSPSTCGSTCLIHVSLGLFLCFPGCLQESCAFRKCCVLQFPLGSELSALPGHLWGTHTSSREAPAHRTACRTLRAVWAGRSLLGTGKPPAPLYPHSTQGKAGLNEKGTKRLENPEDSSRYSYSVSLGTL